MPEICCLDSDECLPLESIYQVFRCGIKEEHSWALIYQSVISLNEYLNQNEGNLRFSEPNQLFIRENGTIHHKSWQSKRDDSKNAELIQIIAFIAEAVYKALDYGIPEDEELIIPSDLEEIIIIMTETNNTDEGIEENSESDLQMILKNVEERCAQRVLETLNVCDHYRSVCRALVAEAIEMSTFLNQVSKGTQELKKIKNVTNDEVEEMHVELWAHLWMKVMRQLRTGVSLKRADKKELISNKQKEYELTPFEMLLDDINSKRYSLKKVSLPKHVEKDARNTILEFIRSRPPLKPAKERVLSPRPKTEPSLHQKLMDGIKQTHNLKPTPKPFERKYDSCHMPRGKKYTAFSIYNKNLVVDGSPVRNRNDSVFNRLSFGNLSLRRSYSTLNLNRKSDAKLDSSPLSTDLTANSVPFWRRIFKW